MPEPTTPLDRDDHDRFAGAQLADPEVRAAYAKANYERGWNAARDELSAALSEAQRERDEARQGLDYWRREAAQTHEFWTDLGNEVLKYAPEDYDDDCAADAIAIRYVRDLETAWGSVRQLAQRWIDEGTADDADALAAAVFRTTGLRQVEGVDIERESVEDALENDRCGICGSVDHFREDHAAVDSYETQTGGTE